MREPGVLRGDAPAGSLISCGCSKVSCAACTRQGGGDLATGIRIRRRQLPTWVGCAVDTSEVAALFGDETELYADTREADLDRAALAVFVARHLGRGRPGFHRIGLVGKFLATAGRSVQRVMEAHCREASDLAGRL